MKQYNFARANAPLVLEKYILKTKIYTHVINFPVDFRAPQSSGFRRLCVGEGSKLIEHRTVYDTTRLGVTKKAVCGDLHTPLPPSLIPESYLITHTKIRISGNNRHRCLHIRGTNRRESPYSAAAKKSDLTEPLSRHLETRSKNRVSVFRIYAVLRRFCLREDPGAWLRG